MANGLLPYVDFIDVKGPLLFVIQLVGWEISRGTTTGVWLLETGAVFLTLLSLYKLGRVEKLTRSQACLASLLCLACIFSPQLYGGAAGWRCTPDVRLPCCCGGRAGFTGARKCCAMKFSGTALPWECALACVC